MLLNPKQQTQAIANSVIQNINTIFPLSVSGKTLEIKNVQLKNLEEIDPTNYHEIAKIKAHDKTFGASIYGDVILKEGDKEIDRKTMKLATAPAMANDGTFIINGSQFSIDKQLRLRPGIYSRVKQNGEIEAHVNPNGFKNLRLSVDPATKKLTIGVQQANINALPVLNILGIHNEEIKKTFGEDVFNANTKYIGKRGDEEIKRFFKSVNPNAEMPSTAAEVSKFLAEELSNAKLDPKVTQITLGQKFDHLNGRTLLRGLKKVVNVARGTEQPDDRDALAFKTIHSVEDFIDERLKKNKRKIQFDVENRMRKSDDLSQIMNSGHINQHIYSFFNSAALSEIPSQINPLAIINAAFKTTITGEGGIENEQAIMAESQALHPSHLGYLDPLNTPESKKIGVTLNLAVNTSKDGNELTTLMHNIKTNKTDRITPIDAYHYKVALPDQELKGKVTVVHQGKQIEVDAKDVTHQIPSTHGALTMSSQVLPALNHNQGNRAGMASRHINQAISLKHREEPLVQVKSPMVQAHGDTAERYFGSGHSVSIHAPENGQISKITESHIHFLDDNKREHKIPIFNNFDLQNKSYLHHEIDHLTPGMKFKKNDLIADSNFTRNGTLALGTNLRTAYMPWKGLNFEDGIVVSESAAHKLTSNHLFQDHIDKDNTDILIDKKKFTSLFPSKYTRTQLSKIDDNGIAKQDAILNPGDPYALVLHKNTGTQEDLMLNRLHKSLVQPYKDMSKTWEQLQPGIITRSVNNIKNVKIHAKYESPAIVGDKLALRHGNKGVITAIVPDNEMPHTSDKKHTEVIISPLSIITRMSMGQMLENSASKIAEKTGKPYVIKNFAKENQLEKIKSDLKKHNISDTEELFDPSNGKSFGNVMIGKPFVEKLFKTAKGNLSAHEIGTYDIDNKPTRGGEEGSKAIDALTLYGLLAHGKRGILNEVSTIKGDGNAAFWQNLQNGLPTSKPQIPFVYKKFEALMNASGINIQNDSNKKIFMPLTDKHALELTGNNELNNFKMLDYNFEPIKGGLFDPQLTGGSNGQKWSKVSLAHPIVNPMFEGAVKSVLDLKDSEFKAILREEGGHAKVKGLLANVKIHEQIDSLTKDIPDAPKTKKDKLLKKLKILKALDYLNMSPDEAYTTSIVPITPPQFRPIFEIPGGHVQTHSLNFLYRDLGLINDTIKQFGATPELSNQLYQSLSAVQGVTSPISKSNDMKGVKGALKIITGEGSPKHGFFQNKVLRKQQDLSARATAVLNNNLNMDQIAIPEKIAKVVYKPFAIKELLKQGYNYQDSEKHIDDFSDIGKKAIQASMQDRPILMNRAPSLHRFSIMSFKPTLTKGLSIEVPGLIVKPYSLDFDGDTTVLHVPVTEQARKESFKLLPSQNLYNSRARTLNYVPDQEAIVGLYLLSQSDDGRKKINSLLPKNISHITDTLKKGKLENILEQVAQNHPNNYNDITTKLKELGDHVATGTGFSVSLNDLPDHRKFVNEQYAPAIKLLHSPRLKDEQKISALLKADNAVKSQALANTSNSFVTMATSGGRGSAEQIKQISFAPGILQDHTGNAIMRPVLNNYSQGMPFADYWTTLYGARKGSLDKQLMTSKPGALNKEIVNTSMNLVVAKHDCGTTHGLEMQTGDPHIMGRYLNNGTLITKSNIDGIRKKHSTVIVRSPSTCELPHGICQKCYGIDEYNTLPGIGDNIGIKAAQAISEPLTQSAMKTFHLGGTMSGTSTFGEFKHIANFLQAPETFANKATLASKGGHVTDIKPGSAGGWHIDIDGESHFVNPKSGELLVKKGDKIKKGDLLNYGLPHPKDAIKLLGETRGIHKIVDTLSKIYKDAGIQMDRRNIETVTRGTTSFGIIHDEGTHPHFVKNDVVPLSAISTWNSKVGHSYESPIHDSYGKILTKSTGNYKAGQRITNDVIKNLEHSHKNLHVKDEPINYERTFIGVQQAPLFSNDVVGRLGYRYLKRGLQESALYANSSDIHGYSPILPFVTGTLGTGEAGTY